MKALARDPRGPEAVTLVSRPRGTLLDYRAVLTAALHAQAYSDHWGTRCDVFDFPGMDQRADLGPSSDATLAFYVVPADRLTLARVFYPPSSSVTSAR